MNGGICALCKNFASQTCSQCNCVFYCTRQHQKDDWKNHKKVCAPFKVQKCAQLGRHIIATRDIGEGEIVMKKFPLMVSPKIASYPLCLSCHRRLDSALAFYKCAKCKWPMCDVDCERNPSHVAECKIFALRNYHPQIQNSDSKQGCYAIIAPLRALLLKTQNKSKYDTLMNMQSHLQHDNDTALYKVLRANLLPIFKLLQLPTDEEEVLTICSIFDTNAFEIRDSNGLINIRGLYPMASLLAHNCKVNTKHSFHDGHQIHIIATTPIKKGEIITTTYTQTLWCTLARRAHLKQAKKFDCDCTRCRDPTELGTYAGSLICQQCAKFIVSSDPLDASSKWVCEGCDNEMLAEDMVDINRGFKREVAEIDRSRPEGFEEFLKKYEHVLHGTNCHVLEVKYALVQMYGNIRGYKLNELSHDTLCRKIDLCNQLIAVAEILEPGSSRFRGNILNELQEAMIEQIRRDKDKNKLKESEYKEKLMECLGILENAVRILDAEPDMEGVLNQNLEHVVSLIHE